MTEKRRKIYSTCFLPAYSRPIFHLWDLLYFPEAWVRAVSGDRLSYFSNDRSRRYTADFPGHASAAIIHGWKLIRRRIRRWSRRQCLLSALTGCILSSYPLQSSCITRVQIWANWTYFRVCITRLYSGIHYGRFYVRIRLAGMRDRTASSRWSALSSVSFSSSLKTRARMRTVKRIRVDKGRGDKDLSWIDHWRGSRACALSPFRNNSSVAA